VLLYQPFSFTFPIKPSTQNQYPLSHNVCEIRHVDFIGHFYP